MTTYRSKLRQMIIRLKNIVALRSMWKARAPPKFVHSFKILLWTANAQWIRLMGYSSMSHTSWWSAQNNKHWIHALITKQSEWSHKIDRIISSNMHQCSLWSNTWSSMSHKHSISSTQKQTSSKKPPNKAREKTQHSLSLEAYDLYIFSPFGNKLPKSS